MCSIDWEVVIAFLRVVLQPLATLGAGGLAVFGAMKIAGKQMAILHRQADIADGQRLTAERQAETHQRQAETANRQAYIAQMTQRISLFDKRFDILQALETYISTGVSEGRAIFDQPTNKEMKLVLGQLEKGMLLFNPAVAQAIDRAIILIVDFSTELISFDVHEDRQIPELRIAMMENMTAAKRHQKRALSEMWENIRTDAGRLLNQMRAEMQLYEVIPQEDAFGLMVGPRQAH